MNPRHRAFWSRGAVAVQVKGHGRHWRHRRVLPHWGKGTAAIGVRRHQWRMPASRRACRVGTLISIPIIIFKAVEFCPTKCGIHLHEA